MCPEHEVVRASDPARAAGEVARRIWVAAGRGDAEALLELFAPDVLWVALGDHPWARRLHGAESVLEYLAEVGDAVGEMRLRLKDLYEGEGGAVLHFALAARHGDATLDAEYLQLIEVRDGRAVKVTSTALDRERTDEFWRRIP